MEVEFFESVDSLDVFALFDESLISLLFFLSRLTLVFHAVMLYCNKFYNQRIKNRILKFQLYNQQPLGSTVPDNFCWN